MRRLLDTWFGVDLRSLAVFRIAVALVLIADLAARATDLSAHYTDAGVFPATAMFAKDGWRALLSVHYHASASTAAVTLLFVLEALAALALLVGYRTRLATLLSWYLLLSLQVRNPLVAGMGGDYFLRLLLFWGLFLPLGARASVDARRDRRLAESANRLVSVPAAVLLLQVAVVYWTTGAVKEGDTWADGTALHYALRLDYWVTPLGLQLREFGAALPWLTHATRWFELLGPFLAFSPYRTEPLRFLAVVAFLFFHVGLALGLDIGPFPIMCMAAWMAFLPGWFWDVLLPRLLRRPSVPSAPEAGRIGTPAPLQIVAGALMALSVVALVFEFGPARRVSRTLGISQRWSMFAPDPPLFDSWPVLDGRLVGGGRLDPLRHDAPSHAKPERLREIFPGFRWKMYFRKLHRTAPTDRLFEPLHVALTNHFCAEWNSTHDDDQRLGSLAADMVIEETMPHGEAPPRIVRGLRRRCP